MVATLELTRPIAEDELGMAFTALLAGGYDAPEVLLDGGLEAAATEECPCWVIVIGASFALALAWAAYCTSQGGHPSISFGWKGFSVRCS